jgi:hypothetical protein
LCGSFFYNSPLEALNLLEKASKIRALI